MIVSLTVCRLPMISFFKAKALKKLALLTMGTMLICFSPSPIIAAEKEPFTPLGAPSCASAACHNQNLGRGIPFSEYTTWTGFDPHHKAYASLFNSRSDRIVKNLYNTGAGSAGATQLCLNCHASNQGKSEHAGPGFSLTEGVGCESCHGSSSGYISVHFTEKFKKLSTQEKEKEYGLTNTKDLSSRNKMCADCHVGNAKKGMEVNHDLIAAGHPRLNFELSAYSAQYPKHWKIEDDLKRYPDFNAKAWAVGQIQNSKIALELLEDRTTGLHGVDGNKTPWPEFTEFDCFSCHKDLKLNSKKYQGGYSNKPGSLPWGGWFNGNALKLVLEDSKVKAFPTEVSLQMNQFGAQPSKVGQSCKKAIEKLEIAAQDLEKSPTWSKSQLLSLAKKLIDSGKINAEKGSWDEFAQLYLGLAAIHNSWDDLDPQGVPKDFTKELVILGDLLKDVFPKGFDSPRLFEDKFSFNPRNEKSDETFSSVFRSLHIALESNRR
jgi:hypothetical protein